MDGVREGPYYTYRSSNGRLTFELNMRDGQMDGDGYLYYTEDNTPEGRIDSHLIYKNNKIIFNQRYLLDGTEKNLSYLERFQEWKRSRDLAKLFDTVQETEAKFQSGEIGGRQAANELEEAIGVSITPTPPTV